MELLTKFEQKPVQRKNEVVVEDYLLNLGKVKDRCKRFCELIPELSIEYFQVRLTSGDFRKITETYEQGLLSHLPQKERIEKAKESARLRDHTLAAIFFDCCLCISFLFLKFEFYCLDNIASFFQLQFFQAYNFYYCYTLDYISIS